jgi:peptidoglycan/LPS O-acetylase OafA/YrhL
MGTNNFNVLFYILQFFYKPLSALIYNGLVAVDTFFLLSGFLVCYVFLQQKRLGKPFNAIHFYLYRYLR